jgi:hypothetical protein
MPSKRTRWKKVLRRLRKDGFLVFRKPVVELCFVAPAHLPRTNGPLKLRHLINSAKPLD